MAGHRVRTALALATVSAGLQIVSWGGAARPTAPTLLVVPGSNISILQVGFDLLESRSAVLVSYQQSPDRAEPVLHVWDGAEWRALSAPLYESFGYLRLPPSQVILVGKDDVPVPPALAVAAWEDQYQLKVQQVSANTTGELLDELGRIFDFRRSEWEWYAARYGLDISDANQDRRTRSWYDQPMVVDRTESGAVMPAPSTDGMVRMEPEPIEPMLVQPAPVEHEPLPMLDPVPTPGVLSQPPIK